MWAKSEDRMPFLSAEGYSFSIRIAGRGWDTRHEKTSVLVPIGKPRTRRVRGFSMVHVSDSEAHTDGRAFLFAEDHMTRLKSRNPRPRPLRAAGGSAIERERVFPSRRVSTGSG